MKPDVQVSIGHCIIENENKVTGRPKSLKNAKMGILGRQGDTYAFVGQPSNLVFTFLRLFYESVVFFYQL